MNTRKALHRNLHSFVYIPLSFAVSSLACNFLHCLFVCVSMPTDKRSTGEVVLCKILKVNQDGTMSIEYLPNGKWIPHRTPVADNIVDDEDFEV